VVIICLLTLRGIALDGSHHSVEKRNGTGDV
jgi:signal peptidase II